MLDKKGFFKITYITMLLRFYSKAIIMKYFA